MELPKCVRVCQGRTCSKMGAVDVLEAFRVRPVAGFAIAGCSCLGQCGNGPMVVILPEQVWYDRVGVAEVPVLIERHLQAGQPVAAMLYRKFHP